MQYRYIMLAIAVLIVSAGCVSALTISTSTVRTEDGEVSMTSSTSASSGSAESETISPDENGAEESEEEIVAAGEEGKAEESEEEVLAADEEDKAEEDAELFRSEGVIHNCSGAIGNELIVKFEPEHFERADGTLDTLAMEEVEREIHSSINALLLSDMTEFGMPGLQLVRLPEGISLEEGIAYYEAFPEVRFAEPNYQISIYPIDECADSEVADEIMGEAIDEDSEITCEAIGEDPETLENNTTLESQITI